ncbi:MAG: class I SAM-dependent methyltransferase [Holophagaceae bacterium]|nr:class I SAM-dependent methyltransferase [Holophagaceae bacterium]
MSEFDARAGTWDQDPAKVARALTVGRAIAEALPLAGLRVLEYGCGTGLLGFALQPQAAWVSLADTSEGMLAVLRAKIAAAGAANMSPLRLDLLTEPLPEARFDLVCSLMTLHHIPDTQGILDRFCKVLAPGGWVALADLDAEDGSFHGPEAEVHRGFDREAFRAQLTRAGFHNIHLETVCEVDKDSRRYPVFLAVARRD